MHAIAGPAAHVTASQLQAYRDELSACASPELWRLMMASVHGLTPCGDAMPAAVVSGSNRCSVGGASTTCLGLKPFHLQDFCSRVSSKVLNPYMSNMLTVCVICPKKVLRCSWLAHHNACSTRGLETRSVASSVRRLEI